MRYALVIPDGAADRPHPSLQGRTPLQAATLPHLARLARAGRTGRVLTVPTGFKPGSDVANLSVLGYDPATCYTGRAPLEAASMGLTLAPDQAVFRANTVTVADGAMRDYAAGHIPTAESGELIAWLNARLEMPGVRLHAGKSYRHLCVVDGLAGAVPARTPPHDISGRAIAPHAPVGEKAGCLLRIEARTRELLAECPVNEKRQAAGHPPVTQLWLWGGGVMPRLESFAARFGVRGGLISAVDLLQGIARLSELTVIDVPGATGYYDTDYRGKGAAAVTFLQDHDFVAVHVEAPDEAGHNGDSAEKVRALENIDRHILGALLAEAEAKKDLRILCLPDHPTPLESRTHTADPVPFALWGPGIGAGGPDAFTEEAVAEVAPVAAQTLLPLLFA